eukprot:Lithocolla_globosa_v1_NODE_1889_length_2271_cov_14.911101.p4 type:complete len:129 gc:universal NODE_1889_length_2271_cov_14.911101:785-1171(+)
MKSERLTLMALKLASSTFAIVPPLTCREKAKEVADFTKPSSSAPLKFLVNDANSSKSTSSSHKPLALILLVWMRRICCLPLLFGSEISTCTSKRPGRVRASSIMSCRLVMPITRMLLMAFTPSILDSN